MTRMEDECLQIDGSKASLVRENAPWLLRLFGVRIRVDDEVVKSDVQNGSDCCRCVISTNASNAQKVLDKAKV